jgi:hypothetical protein
MIRSFLEEMEWRRHNSAGQRITVVHGAAKGADEQAGIAAEWLGLDVETHPADWRGRGQMAGLERNQLMLSLGADLVVAFKHDFDGLMRRGGTEHMIRIAMEAGVRTTVLPIDTRGQT